MNEQQPTFVVTEEPTPDLPAYVRRAVVAQRNKPSPAATSGAAGGEGTPRVSAFIPASGDVAVPAGRRRLYRSDIRNASKQIRRDALRAGGHCG